MESDAKWLCPRCKLHWKRVVMTKERGSWSLEWILKCPECRLWDYPDDEGVRRFGLPILVKEKRRV